MSETPIRIVFGEHEIQGRLSDNPAARALLADLPLTLEFSDYGGQEVTGGFAALPLDGMPAGNSAPAGTIGYYAPGGVIVLYYRDVGYYDGIVRLGRMEGDYAKLAGWSGKREVRIEVVTHSNQP